MEEKKLRDRFTNWAVRELTGLDWMDFNIDGANTEDLDEAEKILSLMISFEFLREHITSGRFMDEYLSFAGYKKDSFSSQWRKQTQYIYENSFANHSRHALFTDHAFNVVCGNNSEQILNDIRAGKQDAITRFNTALTSALLMIARHPDADHAFFKAILGDIQDYTKRKSYPKFQERKPLTQDEKDELSEICSSILSICSESPGTTPYQAVIKLVCRDCNQQTLRNAQPTRFATLGDRILDISDRQYQFALSVRPESAASVLPVPEDIMPRLKFDDKTGQLSITDENNEALSTLYGRLENWTSREKVTASDFMFLRTALTALYKNREFIDADRVTIKRSDLGKHMGANLTAGNAVDVLARLKPLEKLIGRTPDGSIYRVFTFLKYDSATDSYSFACPFINQVILRLEDKNQVKYKSKTKGLVSYNAPHINFLLHSTLHKERNKRAVEIVMALTNLMLQRAGEYTRKPTGRDRFDAHIKYSTLISYCPLLEASLEDSTDKANKNRILKSAFAKAAVLLKEQTDAYTYFENLTVSDMRVTNSTLDETIRISFTGIHRAD